MSEILHEGRYLRLVKKNNWEFVERTTGKDVVVIFAFTPDQRLILVEQYRAPVDARVIELPAGLTGDVPSDAGANMLETAARRELLEETGYEADKLTLLTSGPSSCGMTNETINIFHATGLKLVGLGGGVDDENITVHKVPIGLVDIWLQMKRKEGVLVDYKVYSSLYLAGNPANYSIN